uniref:HAT C-terminal dimerisation domain-containing protein n=1 Tax=Maylandia zebra TaxID=106582 RepID=A0A3P9DLA7_9CICH
QCSRLLHALSGQTKLAFTKSLLVPEKFKKETRDKCVQFVCQDIRPYDTISGKGFTQLAQHLVDTAARIGKFDVCEILPHPTTVSRNVEMRAQSLRKHVVEEITATISKFGCAVTADIWTETYRKTSFLSATIHYVNEQSELHSRVLFAAPFDPSTSKTGENIRRHLLQNLRVFGIDATDMGKKIIFVTDRGANMISALREYTRLNCTAHILNVTLSSAFGTAIIEKSPEIASLLTDVKKLVTYFKHSGQQGKLKKSLKQSIETRWNSNFDMLNSVLEQYEDIASVLTESNNYDKIGRISISTLKLLVSFLKPFKEATDDLETDNTAPSASLVLPWSVRLIEHYSTSSHSVHMLYKIATFLTPNLRGLRMLDERGRQNVIQGVKEMIDDLKFDHAHDEDVEPTPAKRPTVLHKFSDWEEEEESCGSKSLDVQIQEYRTMKLELSSQQNILQWWNSNSSQFPALSNLARFVLCIPATSAPSERAFSLCGRILEERRSVLKPSSVSDILFLHGNLK